MKNILSFSIIILSFQFTFAQSDDFFLVNLAIEKNSFLHKEQNNNVKSLLFKKLTGICDRAKGVLVDQFSEYYLIADIYPIQAQTSTAGFMPVGIYKMNLNLRLIYKTSGKTFKQLDFSKQYSVNTELEAAELLINEFSFPDNDLNDFFDEGRKKMKKFYTENCKSILQSVKKYQSIGEPEKALAICISIPADVSCYTSIEGMTKSLYTSLSYKSDYSTFLRSQELVSKGDYENAFSTINEISIYSQFYTKAQELSKQINDFIFSQKELQKKKEIADSEQKLKETEIELQQKRKEIQESINQTNIEIANQKNASDRQIATLQLENEKQMKALDLESQEKKQMIKSAENLLNSYLNKRLPDNNINFYIIK